ncbi:hypothetical protein AB0C88_16285 [Streptomyces chartreusis]|uniref:hypothetical protein n=1 Tax=Streptomyces chartreusis TaxID=1969 RepID=UPI0034048B1E
MSRSQPAEQAPAITAGALPSALTEPLRTYAIELVHLDVDTELRMAREALAKADQADIHTPHDMIRTAVELSIRLRTLIAAVEAGEGQ